MGRLFLGILLMVMGVVVTIISVSRSMSITADVGGVGIDLYNSLSSVYDALRWSLVGLLMTIIGGTLTVIGFVKRNSGK
jgi:uncharacterized membrane protein